MGLFGRRSPADPATWDELWSVLSPLGGRLTPETVESWSELVSTSSPGSLEAAAEQLGNAYRMLGTEAHAREIGPGAFVGADRPFAAGRLARIVDTVVVAGPDEVLRVAGDPTAIRSFAEAVPLLDPALSFGTAVTPVLGLELLRATMHSRLATGGELRAPRRASRPIMSVGWLDKARLRQWPSLAGRRPDEAFYGIRDPEVPWLSVEAWELAPDLEDVAFDVAPAADEAPDDWVACGFRAREELVVALGSDVLQESNVLIVVLQPELAPDPGGDASSGDVAVETPAEPSVNSAGLMFVPVPVASSELVPGPAADEGARRVGVIARACARTLLTLPQVATPARLSTLKALAGE